MSMKLAVQCWELVLSHAEYKILSALCDEADDDGTHCYPGVPYLIWKTSYDERTIHRTLRSMEAAGWITVAQQASGPGVFTEYAIHIERIPRKTPWREVKRGQKSTGKMPAHFRRRADIPSEKHGHSVPKGLTSTTPSTDIPSVETDGLPDAIAENAIRPVVNPVNDPKDDPTDVYSAPASPREIRSVPKPSQLLAAEQAASPSWAALVREADSPPVPGAEHERWTATWRNLQDWATRAGLDDAQLAGEVHARARRYSRKFTTPYTTPALGANWAALAHDPPPKSEAAPARASPGDRTESTAQAKQRRTIEAIYGVTHGPDDVQPAPVEARFSVVRRGDGGARRDLLGGSARPDG